MSRFVVVCLLLSISQISVSAPESMTEFSKRILSDIGSLAAKKTKENCLTFNDEFKKCQKEPQDYSVITLKKDFPYDQNCLQRLNDKTNQALKNNLKLLGAGLVADAAVGLTASALVDLGGRTTGLALKKGFSGLAIVPVIGLVADTWGLWMIKCDTQQELNKLKQNRSR